MANAATPKNSPEEPFVWTDLDVGYSEGRAPIKLVEEMIDRQIKLGGNLNEPGTAAQELLGQWQLDNDCDVEDGGEPIYWLALWQEEAAKRNTDVMVAARRQAENVVDISEPLARERHANDQSRNPDGENDEASELDGRFLNDAEILGTEQPDLADFYAQPMTFMTGEMYGQGDRRNTRDGDWKAATMPLINWLEGGDGWGLSKHPVAKSKAGKSIVPSENMDGQRKDAAIKTMYAIGIDIDSGASLDDVVDKLEASGYFGIVYTTYNHRKTVMELKHDEVVRKMQVRATLTCDF